MLRNWECLKLTSLISKQLFCLPINFTVVYYQLSNVNFNLQEFDHPHVLLKNENGYLYRMVQQTGHSMAESLLRVAQEVCVDGVC
jgi:hypothetical protein